MNAFSTAAVEEKETGDRSFREASVLEPLPGLSTLDKSRTSFSGPLLGGKQIWGNSGDI